MKQIYHVTINCGDGSNAVQWVMDKDVIARMYELAAQGNEQYSSGDGLQICPLHFHDDFNLEDWIALNYIDLVTLEDLV